MGCALTFKLQIAYRTCSTNVCVVRFSAVRVAAERPGDRVGRAVRHRQRSEHRPYHLPDAGLRGARSAADLPRPHDRRHHPIPRTLHSGTRPLSLSSIWGTGS